MQISVTSEASVRKVLQHLGHSILKQILEVYYTSYVRHTWHVFAAETYECILEGLEICSRYTPRIWFCFLLKFLQSSTQAKSKALFICFCNRLNRWSKTSAGRMILYWFKNLLHVHALTLLSFSLEVVVVFLFYFLFQTLAQPKCKEPYWHCQASVWCLTAS